MVHISSKNSKEHIVIGIAGSTIGVGVTHLCIALANFFASKQRKRTACIECQKGSSDFEELGAYRLPSVWSKSLSAHRCFQIYDVDYYPSIATEDIPILLNCGYEILILDFGQLHPGCMDELYRCDKRFLLCSTAPWLHQRTLDNILYSLPVNRRESFSFMMNYGTSSDTAEFAKKLDVSRTKLHTVPFLPNPFHISKEQFSFFEKLL